MKLCAVVVGLALFVAVNAESFQSKCIRLDVDGTVTVTATKKGTEKKEVVKLSDAHTITGNCTNTNTTVTMTVTFDNVTNWVLVFNNKNNQVKLDQTVRFEPAILFNDTSVGNDTVGLSNSLDLSSSNTSYLCHVQQTIKFKSETQGGYTFTVTQNISNFQVQAFGLVNNTFSPAEDCKGDLTTVAPATTPPPIPTVDPVAAQTFLLKDAKGIVCFRLQAGLQFVVEYNTTHNTMVFSKPMTIPSSANVTGTCATTTTNTATMTISGADYALTITEMRTKDTAVSAIQLNVSLDSTNFPNAEKVNETVSFEMANVFALSSAKTFYMCQTEQTLHFNKTRTTLYADKVRLQAFNLKNGSFTGDGVECSLDPTPKPITPSSTPGDNTYTVSSGNVTCIVLKGEISFSNVTYAAKGGMATADTLNIPALNTTTHNVKFNGNCSLEGGSAQQLVITFNNNWTLALTFARHSSKDSSMLTTDYEYSVRDIEFTYYLIPQFFPNGTQPYAKMVASQKNITSDFMKGSTGGSYKCDAEQKETLDTGAQFETFHLQYKAFNTDNKTDFNNNVSECSADDESNSIVPIAVGAALAGLVVIVLIAYLIGRRRSRRQGYESV